MKRSASQTTDFTSDNMTRDLLRLAFLANFLIIGVVSHGRLTEPPSRASMWKFGFDSPPDYNDHESYCGGYSRMWQRNSGKCGICGDPYDDPEPRAHETGGKYGNGVIVRRYRTGSLIPVRVQLTANHFGHFEFRICPMTYRDKEVTQECLDKNLLNLESGSTRYYPGPGNEEFEMYIQLPHDLTCAQCVFQWIYIAGNNWNDCGNGTGAVGCGPQEEFRACADVTIGDHEATLPPRPETTTESKYPSSTEPAYLPESGPAWLFNLVIAGTCLLVILVALALVYSYYYHAPKWPKWLMSRWMGTTKEQPVPPPRHRRHQPPSVQLQF